VGTKVDERIYVDATQPASLLDGAAVTDCPTLQEAIIAWHRLPKERRRTATIRTATNVFTVQEIERLYSGPEPEVSEPPESARPFQPDPSKWGTSNFDDVAARIATSRSQRNDAVLNSGGTQAFPPPEPNPIATLESATDRTPPLSGEISPTIQARPVITSGVSVLGQQPFPSGSEMSPTIQPQAGTPPHGLKLETGKYALEGGSINAGAGGMIANADVAPAQRRVIAQFRDNPERAEMLARALATTVREEIERLEDQRRNEPEWRDQIDFLRFVANTLDNIAVAIAEARRAAVPDEREQKFAEAERWATSLAKAAKDFAERNYDRVVDFGGYCPMTVLGTLLFTQLLGVSPDVAFVGAMGLLGFGKKKD